MTKTCFHKKKKKTRDARRNLGRNRASRGAVRPGDPGEQTQSSETLTPEARDRGGAIARSQRGRRGRPLGVCRGGRTRVANRACARFAAPGEVVVSPECASLEEMQDHAEFEPVWGPSVGSDEEDVVSSDDGSASENDAYLSNKKTKTKKRVRVGAFRFPSARKWEKLFAGAPETRETRDAGDASFAFPGAFRSRAPWSRMRSGTSTRSRRSHRSAWTDRESNGSNRTPNPEPLRVARLTNGFDGATVAAAISPPRPSADRDAMLRDVLRLFRDTRNDTISGTGPDIRQARMVDPADALVKALERYVPAPARGSGDTK